MPLLYSKEGKKQNWQFIRSFPDEKAAREYLAFEGGNMPEALKKGETGYCRETYRRLNCVYYIAQEPETRYKLVL